MICSSCGRTVEDGMAFCPHCGSAVIQPFMTEEDKAREDAEVEAALKSLDEIKRTVAKPVSVRQDATAPIALAPPKSDFRKRHSDSRSSQLIVALLCAIGLAVALFVLLPRFIMTDRPSSTPTIAERDPNEAGSPIGDLPVIEELSAQDDPDEEAAVIAYNAYDVPSVAERNRTESGFVLPDSDTHRYTVEELEELGLTEWDLEIARNEIFARHGRGFYDSTLQAYFDAQDWYEQTYTPEEFDAQSGLLNEIEAANVTTIAEVEDSL